MTDECILDSTKVDRTCGIPSSATVTQDALLAYNIR